MLFVLTTAPDTYAENLRVIGNVSGEWGWEDDSLDVVDTIFVEGNITTPFGETLEIAPKVEVLFEGNFNFNVRGTLVAQNGPEVDQFIIFDGLGEVVWQGITFRPGSSDESVIQHCLIKKAWIGVNILGSSPYIFENTIFALNRGISCEDSRSRISLNNIIVGGENSNGQLTGIHLENEANVVIDENHISVIADRGGIHTGIRILDSNPRAIEFNYIDVVSIGQGYGIYSLRVTKLELVNNIIRVTSSSPIMGGRFENTTGALLLNNSFHLLGISETPWGLKIESGSRIVIINNIVLGNGFSRGIESAENTVFGNSDFNDFWGHLNEESNYVGYWQGGEHDIIADPLFVNATINPGIRDDYALTWTRDLDGHEIKSPCIDTGSDLIEFPELTDMGAVPYDGEGPIIVSIRLEENEILTSFKILDIYPNPFNSTAQINFTLGSHNMVVVDVYDSRGRLVKQLWNGYLNSGKQKLTWSPLNVGSGSYYVRVLNGEVSKTVGINYIR